MAMPSIQTIKAMTVFFTPDPFLPLADEGEIRQLLTRFSH